MLVDVLRLVLIQKAVADNDVDWLLGKMEAGLLISLIVE